MMKKGILTAWVILFTGCASVDRAYISDFQPIPGTDGKGFSYTAEASRFDKPADQKAEAKRMNWLNDWITENHYCLSGYTITRRTAIENGHGGHTIHYEGVCN